MESIEIVVTTRYGNFRMSIYKDRQYSDLSVTDVMNIVIKSYNDEEDYIYIFPINGKSLFIKKKYIIGFEVYEGVR